MLQGVLFLIFLHFIFSCKPSTSLFLTKPQNPNFNSPVLISLKSFVRRKPIPVFDPRPLCCSSLTTAVGGTTDTNFVDSAHPTVARIKHGLADPPSPSVFAHNFPLDCPKSLSFPPIILKRWDLPCRRKRGELLDSRF